MSTLYEVWDYEASNCIGAYPDQRAALADVRATVRKLGPAAVASLVLLTAPDDGDGERIAAGEDLVRLADADAPALPASTVRAALPPAAYAGKPHDRGDRSVARRAPDSRSSRSHKPAGTWRDSKQPPPSSPPKGSKRGPKKG